MRAVGICLPTALLIGYNLRMPKSLIAQKNFKNKILIAIIPMVVFFIFAKAVHFNFVVWDDPVYLTMNIDVWSFNIKSLVTEYYNGNYHPITMLLYSIQYKLFGLDPAGYHLVNVSLHSINAVLIYILLREYKVSTVIATICTLIWALHPMRIEAVAWIVGLKDLVSTLFCILFILVYKKSSSDNNTNYCKLGILFLLAIMAKGTAIVLLIYIFMDIIYEKKETLKSKYWFFAIICLMSVYVVVQNIMARSEFQGILMEGSQNTLTTALQGMYRLGVYFIVATLSPFHMSFTPYLSGLQELYLYSISGFLVVVISIGFITYYGRTNKKVAIIGVCYFGSYLPSMFLPVVGYTMDRFSYFPSIWLILCMGIFFEKFIKFRHIRHKIVSLAMLVFLLISATTTTRRIDVWRDSITLWEDAIELYSNKPGQGQNLAWAYSNLGWYYNVLEQYDKSIPYLIKANEIDNSIVVYHLNYAVALIEQKQFEKAAQQIKITSELEPGNLYNYFLLAKLIGKNKDDCRELIVMMEDKVGADEKDYRYYYYMASLYLNVGEIDAAIEKATIAKKLKEDSFDIHVLLSKLYYKNNQLEDARESLKKAKTLDINNHDHLKMVLLHEYGIAEKDIYLKNRGHSFIGL